MEQASVKNYSSTTATVKMPHVQSKISAMLDGNWNSGVERLTRYASSYHTSQRSAEVAGSRFLIVWQAEIAGEIWKSLVDRVGRGVNDLESDASGRGVGC